MSTENSGQGHLHGLLSRQLRRLNLDRHEPPALESAWHSLLSRVSAAYDDADRERYTLERSIDVTSGEMAALYEQLERREAEVRAILQNAAEAILTVSEDGAITSFNAAAAVMYGWSQPEIVGQPMALLFPGDQWIPVVGEPGESVLCEGVCTRRNGTTFSVLASVGFQRADNHPGATVIIRDISERKAFEAELEFQASHDSLTGLPNRASFCRLLDSAIAAARVDGTELAVLFCDLDRFKFINDSMGHECGDKVLKEAATRLRKAVRAGDTVARLSGDEFVILCRDVRIGEISKMAARIHEDFSTALYAGSNRIHLTCSLGIAFGAGRSADEMLRNADLAMYHAKKSGVAQSAIFDDALHKYATERLGLENALREALRGNELTLRFQPIVRAHEGTLERVEALLRWQRPEYGLLCPESFLQAAAEAGLMRQIDERVLQLACAEAVTWDAPVPVTVNFSATTLGQPGAVDLVAAELARSGLPPERLAVEIPEVLMGEKSNIVTEALAGFRSLGVGIHLDDFGAKYSSIGRLRDFTLDVLKIDKNFIDSVNEPASRAIVEAIVLLAHSLGLMTVAEGVETTAQLEALQRAGCDYVQGYLIARPLSAQHIQSFVRNSLNWNQNPPLDLASTTP